MGLTSLLLSILAIIVFFLLFVGGIGAILSLFLSILALIFGIIGIKKKENTGIAGTVLSLINIAVDLYIIIIVLKVIKLR